MIVRTLMIVRAVLAVLLVGVIFFGAFICFIGFEAVATDINPGPWRSSLTVLVVVPAALLVLLGCSFFVWPVHRRSGN